jgi:hypothetical protein
MTKRKPVSQRKLLTGGPGNGLVPPNRSGSDGPVIFGPGNIAIGSGFPLHSSRDGHCGTIHNEKPPRMEKNISAGFIVCSFDKNSNMACLEVKLQRSSQIPARVGFATLGTKIVTTSTPKEFANAFSVACATRQQTQGWKPNPRLKFANAFGV